MKLDFLVLLRKANEMNQKQMAKRLDMPRPHLCRFEAGSHKVSLNLVTKWAKRIGISKELLSLCLIEPPIEFDKNEKECFRMLRSFARGKVIVRFDGAELSRYVEEEENYEILLNDVFEEELITRRKKPKLKVRGGN